MHKNESNINHIYLLPPSAQNYPAETKITLLYIELFILHLTCVFETLSRRFQNLSIILSHIGAKTCGPRCLTALWRRGAAERPMTSWLKMCREKSSLLERWGCFSLHLVWPHVLQKLSFLYLSVLSRDLPDIASPNSLLDKRSKLLILLSEIQFLFLQFCGA